MDHHIDHPMDHQIGCVTPCSSSFSTYLPSSGRQGDVFGPRHQARHDAVPQALAATCPGEELHHQLVAHLWVLPGKLGREVKLKLRVAVLYAANDHCHRGLLRLIYGACNGWWHAMVGDSSPTSRAGPPSASACQTRRDTSFRSCSASARTSCGLVAAGGQQPAWVAMQGPSYE